MTDAANGHASPSLTKARPVADSGVLTAFEMNSQIVAKAKQLDDDLTAWHDSVDLWLEANRIMVKVRAEALLVAKAKTVDLRSALVDLETEEETYEAEKWKALREVFKKTVDVRMGQLSALQSGSTILREELRLARVGPQEGP